MTTSFHAIAQPHTTTHRLARYVTYPALLLGNAALIGWAQLTGAALQNITLLGLVATLVILFALERLIPYRREWQPDGKEWFRDFFYFGMNGGIDAAGKMGAAFAVAAVGVWDNMLPHWVALPVAVLVAELSGYWLHRWGHHGWLWKVHGVHHTPDKVNTWNNNTVHFINSLYSGLGKTVPLMLLGFDPDVIVIAAYVSTLQSYAVHANIDVDLGWLGYLIMGPSHHRLHHSTKLEEAGNFASAITLWDIVFGTFTYQARKNPAAVGVVDPRSFPAPNDVLGNQIHPFHARPQSRRGGG